MEKVDASSNLSRHLSHKQGWTACAYCINTEFSKLQDFIKHLRQKHCTQEGGSFVCRYGDNKVCCTLPVEGVSDADYEQHVHKHHAFSGPTIKIRKISSVSMASNHSRAHSSDDGEKWTVYSASQNLPAVLNDPSKGKQKDFFTKMWGDGFVEVTNIPGPSYLPNITLQHFQGYLRKIAKRHRKHTRLNALMPKPAHADLLQTFPNLRIGKPLDKLHLDISTIPKIFLEQNFNLSSLETFSAVYPHTAISPTSSSNDTTSTTSPNSYSTQNNINNSNNNNNKSNINNNYSSDINTSSPNSSAKLLQEKLTHYLDMVEVQIAQQVAQKSEAFFHAMTSHDTLMEQLGQTITIVKTLREKIHRIDNDLVKEPLLIMRCERTRRNYLIVYEKLKLMSSVLQTQPTIQLLLQTPDYVGALDLIYTTQDLLAEELAGVHSFRHLSSELNEMVKVIDTLMAGEFERYATADLNRPLLESEEAVLEGDKLSCIVLGMLRQSSFDFVDSYRRETEAAIYAAVKQSIIEIVASSESANLPVVSESVSLEDQSKVLPADEWTLLLKNATTAVLRLVRRVKNARDVMQRAADVSAGKQSSMVTSTDSEIIGQAHMAEPNECFLSAEDYARVTHRLNSLLIAACQYAQERISKLFSSRSLVWPEENSKEEDANSKVSAHWLAERATLTQLTELSKHFDLLSNECEMICPDAPPSLLYSAFKIQANKFMHRFHIERMTKLSLILESEAWRQTDVPVEFQQLLNHISESGKFSVSKDEVEESKKQGNSKPANVLYVGAEKFSVVGTVLILVDIVAEYCVRAEDIPLTSHSLLRHLSELLQVFNSRTSKLVLGAEAVSDKTGLKKITSINLALVLRALQLILWLIPHVRIHFEGLLPESSRMTALDQVTQQMRSHVRDVQNKLCAIIEPLISSELRQWEAKPPVPSKAFQNVCRHLRKLYEAVAGVLPEEQIEELYRNINTTFKDILREHLLRMNIVNNGGPQHGLVSSELIFYLEDLKRIKALPESELSLDSMDDIWTPRQAVIR